VVFPSPAVTRSTPPERLAATAERSRVEKKRRLPAHSGKKAPR
jgi:hypothetical protein